MVIWYDTPRKLIQMKYFKNYTEQLVIHLGEKIKLVFYHIAHTKITFSWVKDLNSKG